MLVGRDNGPTPVEYVLHALAACLTAGIANIAAARGVTSPRSTSTVEGDIDLLGILGLVRRGPQRLPADQGQLHAARATTRPSCARSSSSPGQRSAVFDVVTNGVPVSIEVDAG